jgi:hypothetical protein
MINEIGKFVTDLSDQFNAGKISVEQMATALETFRAGLPELGIEMKALDNQLSKFSVNTTESADKLKGPESSGGRGSSAELSFSEEYDREINAAINGVTQAGNRLLAEWERESSGWGEMVGGVIGAIFGYQEVGSLLGEAIEKALDLGGSRNVETLGRRAVERFFDEILKTRDFYIRGMSGDFVRFDDLILGSRHAFNEGSPLLDELATYPDQIRNIFRGVGGAIAEMIGGDFIAGTQVGDILMTKFMGDIDADGFFALLTERIARL